MFYLYSYVSDNKPYYVGKGTKNRAWNPKSHSVSLPKNKADTHIIAHFDDNVKALIREWELITFLGLKSEGGLLDNKVKGCCPPDRTGKTHSLTEKTKQKLRKPKTYKRTAGHSEKIARQNRGKKHTEEHKRKISEGCKGKTGTPGNSFRAKIYQVTFPDGHTETIRNIAPFCEEHGLSRSCVSMMVNGKQKIHRGFIISNK